MVTHRLSKDLVLWGDMLTLGLRQMKIDTNGKLTLKSADSWIMRSHLPLCDSIFTSLRDLTERVMMRAWNLVLQYCAVRMFQACVDWPYSGSHGCFMIASYSSINKLLEIRRKENNKVNLSRFFAIFGPSAPKLSPPPDSFFLSRSLLLERRFPSPMGRDLAKVSLWNQHIDFVPPSPFKRSLSVIPIVPLLHLLRWYVYNIFPVRVARAVRCVHEQ